MRTTKADKWFSLYIRLRDCDVNGIGVCVTCGRRAHVKTMDCGHFIGRQHMATRFDEKNAHCQCKQCNGFEEGKKVAYEDYLLRRYGSVAVNNLKIQGRSSRKMNQVELDYIAHHFQAEAKRIAKEKNINLW